MQLLGRQLPRQEGRHLALPPVQVVLQVFGVVPLFAQQTVAAVQGLLRRERERERECQRLQLKGGPGITGVLLKESRNPCFESRKIYIMIDRNKNVQVCQVM